MSEGIPNDEPPAAVSEGPGPARRRSTRPVPRARRRNRLLRIGAVVLVFLLGLVIGMTIEDRPRPGGEQTILNTLRVSTLSPAETVTVTVQGP